jgi:eukaryotic-like serine/threonine-protein kinase
MIPWENGAAVGPYALIAPIGAGGMGEVWKARDTRLDRVVAIKRLAGQHMQRFEREARAIAALNHPYICTLYDIGPDYLVMEYIEGAPVRGPQAAAEALRLAGQIAAALEAAHDKGIVHRDLKPGNILVTRSGVKLLDFGLAKLERAVAASETTIIATQTGAVMGTAPYMSPEQVEARPADARSDIFSFGAVLYEIVSGQRPFDGNTAAAVMSAILRDEPRPFDAPPELQRIVARCLRKAPAERFQTMGEVRTALNEAARKAPGTAAAQPSIAVLPFANMSADKEQEYFSDGLAEEIITTLAHLPGLRVIARTSAFAFKGQHQDIRRIAEALGVTTILEGSVRRAGNRIRVTTQLIAAADGSHLWSERYDRELADVFAIQDEISQAIAAALQIKLAAGRTPFQRYTPNLAAYEAYLKGRHHQLMFAPEALTRAKEYYKQAIALDPNFALPHSLMGLYFIQLTGPSIMPAHEALPAARAAAQRALEIDPSLPEAHAVLGMVAQAYEYDPDEAERRFRLAMAADPVPSDVRQMYGFWYLMRRLRPAEAASEIERSLQEDPLNVQGRFFLALSLLAARRGSDAAEEARKITELNADYWPGHFVLGLHYALEGMHTEALRATERSYSLLHRNVPTAGLLAALLMQAGDADRANEVLQRLGPPESYGSPVGWATFHLVRGEFEKAAEWIEKGVEQRHPVPLPLAMLDERWWRGLRSSSRWPAIASKMNLPETM